MIKIDTKMLPKGMQIHFFNQKYDRDLEVEFPPEVWKNFPFKEIWAQNMAYLATVELALMFKEKEVKYNFPFPLFKSFFDELFMKSFTYSGDVDCEQSFRYIKDLINLNSQFNEKLVPANFTAPAVKEKSINTLTFGKESLLSLGLARKSV